MSSFSSDEFGRVPSCFRLKCLVFVYAIINLLVTGTELLIPVISTCVMVAPLLSGNNDAFHQYLKEEGNRAVWKGPYPANFSVSSSLLGFMKVPTRNEVEATGSNKTKVVHSGNSVAVHELQGAQLKINLHIWSANLMMKCIIFVFGWLLLFAAKRRSYTGCLAWFSFSVPLLVQYTLHFVMDLLIGDFFLRQLHMQILQCLDIVFQICGNFLVAFYLRQLYNRTMKTDTRSPTYAPFQHDNEVTVREIIDQRYG